MPLFVERLSEDELKTIIAYMESTASRKFQELGADAANAWAQRVVDATKDRVEADVEAFNASARKIVGVPAPAN